MKREIKVRTDIVAGWGSIPEKDWQHYNTELSAMKYDAISDLLRYLRIETGTKEPKKITIKIEIETPEFNGNEERK